MITYFLLALALTVSASSEEAFQEKSILEISAGFDGANPQSQDSVIQESVNRFRIKPFNEPGSNDAYYFRFNTKVTNHSDKPAGIELIVEWPVLEKHPDYPYETYYYGDKGEWQWTYAYVKGTEAKLNITVPPGVTYVGCYPRYSYTCFEEFINKTEENKYIKKWIEGKSFHGRDIWCLKITDPEIPDKDKKSVLITARNHPYETSGSYIAEEMINFLKSENPEARKLRENNIIWLIPMLNPDGVVLGMNQQTRPNGVNISYGVGNDDPAVTTLLSAVDKIRPRIWADIHGWPHKGDDGMWCTHKWIADGLLEEIPDSTMNDYIWNVSFVSERGTPENHLWQWLIRTYDSGGVSLSISWYRRNEEDMRKIGIRLINAIGNL